MDLTFLDGVLQQATATVIAATVAWHVSQNWRRQEVGKRRQAVAEEALLTVHKVACALESIRSPWIWPGEMIKDDAPLNGEEGTHYAIQKRLLQHKDAFAELNRAILMTEVHFGRNAAHQIREFYSFINTVVMANDECAWPMAKKFEPDHKRELERQRQRPLHPGDDKLGDEIKATTERIRTILMPHMRMPGEIDPDAPPPRRMAALWRFIGFGR